MVKEGEKRADGTQGPPKTFDMFRNRAIFPIIDQYGNVLAFGGRALGDQQPKYLNTSDTPVFNKRLGVYAANLLRKERHLERVILVEGYMDVVSLTQFGVPGVVATLGTALTNEQAKLLKRFAPRVYLSYDGDSAGQHAILRPGLTNPLLNSGTVTFFDQETDAAMVFSAGGFRQLGFVNHVVGFAVRRHPA